jgi:hypothetical protein
MIVLFGRGRATKVIARSDKRKCPNCGNNVSFALHELQDKFNLFFIPIATYRTQYFLACTICDAGYELSEEDKDEFLRNDAR